MSVSRVKIKHHITMMIKIYIDINEEQYVYYPAPR